MTEKSVKTPMHYDAVIVGGGMVGASLAIAMSKIGKQVLLIEKNEPQNGWLDAAPLRVSAINLASQALLSQLDIWSHINASHKCYFEQLATWESRNNRLVFDSSSLNKPYLGHLVRNEALQLAAYQMIRQHHQDSITTACNGIKDIYPVGNKNKVVLATLSTDEQNKSEVTQEAQAITCDLVFVADGAQSQTRQLANIGVTGWQYQQQCFSITIKTHFPTQHITWQEFQTNGPKAFLPLEAQFASLIWYDSAETVKSLKQLSTAELKSKILATFPPLPGDFDIIQSASFPLVRQQANHYFKNRIVLLGDAAHVINPLAGQGVNLGFKDIEVLISQLSEIDWCDDNALAVALNQYQLKRRLDAQIMSSAMDAFYWTFSNAKAPLKFIRNSILAVVQKTSIVKRMALKKAIGLNLFGN